VVVWDGGIGGVQRLAIRPGALPLLPLRLPVLVLPPPPLRLPLP